MRCTNKNNNLFYLSTMKAYMNLPICNPALNDESGFVSELKSKLGEKDFRSLELQGFIKNAVSKDGNTWALTKEGNKVRNYFLSRPSVKTRVSDWVLRNLLHMNITL